MSSTTNLWSLIFSIRVIRRAENRYLLCTIHTQCQIPNNKLVLEIVATSNNYKEKYFIYSIKSNLIFTY
jgi:hypothetical protein